MGVQWRGKQVTDRIASRLVDALTEIDLAIETEAKKELYPGHGKRTGNLQRAIQGETARIEGRRVVGRVSVKSVPYARKINQRYEYLQNGLRRVRPLARGIIARHTGRS